MIKIKHTEIINGKPCCNVKLVLISSDNGIIVMPKGLKYEGQLVLPIFISETEEIEVGDKKMLLKNIGDKKRGDISITKDKYPWTIYSKIISLSEHFSPEILQLIVDGKLKGGDYCWIECNSNIEQIGSIDDTLTQWIKLNQQNHVSLVEDIKQGSLIECDKQLTPKEFEKIKDFCRGRGIHLTLK